MKCIWIGLESHKAALSNAKIRQQAQCSEANSAYTKCPPGRGSQAPRASGMTRAARQKPSATQEKQHS